MLPRDPELLLTTCTRVLVPGIRNRRPCAFAAEDPSETSVSASAIVCFERDTTLIPERVKSDLLLPVNQETAIVFRHNFGSFYKF